MYVGMCLDMFVDVYLCVFEYNIGYDFVYVCVHVFVYACVYAFGHAVVYDLYM